VISLTRRGPSVDARLLGYDPTAGLLLRLAVAAGFVAAVLVVAAAFVMAQVVSRVFQQGEGLAAVAPALAVLVFLALARAILIWGHQVLAQRSSTRLKARLRGRITRRYLDLGPAYSTGERSGELVSVIVNGMDAVDQYVTAFHPARVLAALIPVFVIFVVLLLDPPSALVLVLTGPMLLLFLSLIGGRARTITERRFLELRWMSAFFLDMLQGTATLKMFGRSEEQVENIREISRQYGNTTMEVLRTAFQTALVLEWGGAVATALVAVEISLRLMAGSVGFERALAVLIIVPEFFLPLRQLAIRYHAGAAGRTAAERMFAILDSPEDPRGAASAGVAAEVAGAAAEMPDAPAAGSNVPAEVAGAPAAGSEAPAHAPAAAATVEVHAPWPAAQPPEVAGREIRFRDISFAYEAGRRPALHGLSFTIPARRSTALVGATGAGKTTAASLLLRFLEPDDGEISVGDTPLAGLAVENWRAALAWVPQRPYLFGGSVAENIRLGRPGASLAEVIDAAREANADAFIRALPHGYETPLGERGLRLSGGQAQRIAIARAVLKDAPMVILDEATSHLDPESERAVAEAIGRLIPDRTVLIISHRLRLALAADQVVVIEAGRAIESGRPDQLLAAGGAFARLVATMSDEDA